MDELSSFQADLLDLLHQGVHGEALVEAIRSRHPERYVAWVRGFDSRAEDVAVRIVQRFGRRTAQVPEL